MAVTKETNPPSLVKPLNKHQLLRARLMAQKQHAATTTNITDNNKTQTNNKHKLKSNKQTDQVEPVSRQQHQSNSTTQILSFNPTHQATKQQSATHKLPTRTPTSAPSNPNKQQTTTPKLHGNKKAVDQTKHYKDIEITACKQCTQPFVYTVPEQKHYDARQIGTPVRCVKCRSKRKVMRTQYKQRRDSKLDTATNTDSNAVQHKQLPIGELHVKHTVTNKRMQLRGQTAAPVTESSSNSDSDSDSDSDSESNIIETFNENQLKQLLDKLSNQTQSAALTTHKRIDLSSDSDIDISDIDSETGEFIEQ